MSTNRQAEATSRWRAPLVFLLIAVLFVLEGTTRNMLFSGSWNSALAILNMGLISAVMALGVNMQWGYAGLFNAGVVGFVALGALGPVLVELKLLGLTDNFEGIAAVAKGDAVRLYILSDDNANPAQKTLMLAFDVK